jgi:hypothetical protein
MWRNCRSLALVLSAAVAVSILACGGRASGEAHTTKAKPGRSAPSACPSVEQVSQAAGFPVTLKQSIGRDPDTWMACQYEMTGRYRANFITITGEPSSKAESVYAELKQAVKEINGQDAAAERVDVGSGGWAFGSEDSRSEAAAVVGKHVYHAQLGHAALGGIGDQKDAMVRVLKLFAN